jgi:hypothetical protein
LLVRDGINGLTYEHRSVPALRAALQRGLDDTEELTRLGRRGYLYSEDGDVRAIGLLLCSVPPAPFDCPFADASCMTRQVPCVKEHISALTRLYDKAQAAAAAPRTSPPPLFRRGGPWRITFDTNPDGACLRASRVHGVSHQVADVCLATQTATTSA